MLGAHAFGMDHDPAQQSTATEHVRLLAQGPVMGVMSW